MKLYLNDASPYARLIRALLVETGLDSLTDLVYVDPWKTPEELVRVNPGSKIPALTLDNGTHLVESACISDYLVWRSGNEELSPASNPNRTGTLRILGLGRAAIDCSFGAVIQQRFAPDSPLIKRWLDALPRIANTLEDVYEKELPRPAFDLAELTVAVAFEYIDFRLPEIQWKTAAPQLAKRVKIIGGRPSMRNTRPV